MNVSYESGIPSYLTISRSVPNNGSLVYQLILPRVDVSGTTVGGLYECGGVYSLNINSRLYFFACVFLLLPLTNEDKHIGSYIH